MQRLRQIGREACRAVLVAGTLAAMVSPGWAQTAPSPRPVGKVAIDQAQVAFIGSASVGGGTLFSTGTPTASRSMASGSAALAPQRLRRPEMSTSSPGRPTWRVSTGRFALDGP